MTKVLKKLASVAKSKVKQMRANIDLSKLDDGDYLVEIPLYHKSLQPNCSLTYEMAAEQYGPDTAEKWSRDGCGIASATIIVDSIRRSQTSHTLMPSVTHLCETYRDNAYIPGIGWSHKGLVDFATDFHIDAYNEPNDTAASICKALIDGWIPIVSVTLYFKGGEKFINEAGEEKTKGKGGHLVVVKGFHIQNGRVDGFFIDDCQNQELKDDEFSEEYVSIEKFDASYSGKSIYYRKRSFEN